MSKRPHGNTGKVRPCGSPLSRLRAARGWTLREASRRSGIPLTHLCELEGAYNAPGLARLQQLARLYGLTLDAMQAVVQRTVRWGKKAA